MILNVVLTLVTISCLPLLLWLLALPPFKVINPGLRFKIASLLVLIGWSICKIVLGQTLSWTYWVAGLLFILACLIFCFMLWSVLCWGYTLYMLLSLNDFKGEVDANQWQRLHAGPKGVRQLTEDRAKVLLSFKLATLEGNRLKISKGGAFLVLFAKWLMNLFGVKI